MLRSLKVLMLVPLAVAFVALWTLGPRGRGQRSASKSLASACRITAASPGRWPTSRRARAWSSSFVGTECPLAAQYAARLQALADKYAEQRASPSSPSTPTSRTRSPSWPTSPARTSSSFRCSRTRATKSPTSSAPQRTPEVFVLDAATQGRLSRPDRRPVHLRHSAAQGRASRIWPTRSTSCSPASRSTTPQPKPVGCHIGRVLTPQGGQRGDLLASRSPGSCRTTAWSATGRARSGRSR